MIALARKAGKREFSDEFVASPSMQALQKQIITQLDPEIEKLGFDKMRSRIVIQLKRTAPQQLEGWADERYRGGPENPLSDADLEAKVQSCCENVIEASSQAKLIDAAWAVTKLTDAGDLMRLLNDVSA